MATGGDDDETKGDGAAGAAPGSRLGRRDALRWLIAGGAVAGAAVVTGRPSARDGRGAGAGTTGNGNGNGNANARTGQVKVMGHEASTNGNPPAGGTMPVIFLAHGAPPLLDDAGWMAELAGWAKALPRPKAVLMVSAHWEAKPVALGATRTVPLVYDFYGFPRRFYEMTYPAPGAPELAERVRALVGKTQPVVDDPERGLDHGAYVPMMAMYPKADVPTLQMSLPTMDPKALYALGRALAPLRKEGVLVVGSGFLTHNLRTIDPTPGAGTPAWAAEFDAWSADVIRRHDVDALLDYRARAPGVRTALPTHEHFVPVVVAAGAAETTEPVAFPIDGFWMGTATKRSVQFG